MNEVIKKEVDTKNEIKKPRTRYLKYKVDQNGIVYDVKEANTTT